MKICSPLEWTSDEDTATMTTTQFLRSGDDGLESKMERGGREVAKNAVVVDEDREGCLGWSCRGRRSLKCEREGEVGVGDGHGSV